MMRKILLLSAIMASSVMTATCAQLQEKSGRDSGTGIFDSEKQKLIVGTWKITAVHCDSRGNNCEWYTGKRVFRFMQNGDLFVNDAKLATYRMKGTTCIIDTGKKRYNVNIISLDSKRLITGEDNRTSTEIYNKVK
jgi:pyruvate/2-oxoglutarate dehydrogenase complex dihydrolipoamide dehydrogenase (E3) component